MRGVRRSSYADEPALLERVFALLDTSFAGLAGHLRAIEPFGMRWGAVSTPFLWVNGDQVLAHVGVLEMALVVNGEEAAVGGIHAVCTHPDHRRRGHFRAVMEEATEWCEQRYAMTMLMASKTELYAPLGFRVLDEHRFVGDIRRSVPPVGGLRRLDLHDPADLRLLHRLLDEREPVSRVLGVVRERRVFLFNRAKQPVWYAEDLDAAFCYDVSGTTLRLYDLVARRVPTLEQVVSRIEESIERVEVYFVPDRLGERDGLGSIGRPMVLSPERHVVDGDSWLMVRGELGLGDAEVMLPRTARF